MSEYHWNTEEITAWAKDIEDAARTLGLEPRDQDLRVVSPNRLLEELAYRGPTGYPHWARGKEFQWWQVVRDYKGFGALETAFNSDPCHAILLPDQPLLGQIVIIAHVYGHNDFFTNNRLFRDMTVPQTIFPRLARQRALVEDAMRRFGKKNVERVLDAARAIAFHRPLTGGEPRDWLLRYCIENSPVMKNWQRRLCEAVEEETQHLVPNIETKIMNEGWASYWQKKILDKLALTEAQRFEAMTWYARVTKRAPSREAGELYNPYHVGYSIYEYIKNLWDRMAAGEIPKGQFYDGLTGDEKLFQVRKLYRDKRFIEDFLNEELGTWLELWRFGPETRGSQQLVVSDTADEGSFEHIRNEFMRDCGLGIFPSLSIVDINFMGRDMWLLRHNWDGRDLDGEYVSLALRSLYHIIGRPVLIETKTRRRWLEFYYYFDGSNFRVGRPDGGRLRLPI